MEFQIFHKRLFTSSTFIAIIYNNNDKEVMAMKVLWSVPVALDEWLVAGETTVPSDR